MATPTAVVAKLHNQASYEEGTADEELAPGTGCVVYENSDGEKRVRSANANEDTKRVVREPRNPPRGLGVEGESPLSQSQPADSWAETVGFNPHDQARCQLADGAAGDSVGWNGSGELTATDPTTVVGLIQKVVDVDGADMAVVEFQ